jgi:hypothetical protein
MTGGKEYHHQRSIYIVEFVIQILKKAAKLASLRSGPPA